MRVFLENVAVVILSDGNNPRILNPDFLDRNAIVPPNWKADNVLVTPPFAQVFYPEGVQIFIDENKLQFTCSKLLRLIGRKDFQKLLMHILVFCRMFLIVPLD